MSYTPMTHDPEAAMREHRERLYWLTLATGVVNIIALAMHLAGMTSAFIGPLIGGMCGSLIVAGMKGNTDGYYQSLVSEGLRWMAAALGVGLLVLWADADSSLVERFIPRFDILAKDSLLLALILSLFFHAGYAFAYLRDLIFAGAE
ncbi:hypothetical protein [Aurantiacibacter sp. MUD61]|uniref:hypothetical protein n=1 Tax=Aurantiacibacter sp. MUD61 TaxID=3009083 RepID=UPI0022F0FA1E|nr:hypothetical protein [Aurantiacibacter sp. MUD61]